MDRKAHKDEEGKEEMSGAKRSNSLQGQVRVYEGTRPIELCSIRRLKAIGFLLQ